MHPLGYVTDLEDGILFDQLVVAASRPEFAGLTVSLGATRLGSTENYKLDEKTRSALFPAEGLDKLRSFSQLTFTLAWAGNVVSVQIARKPAEALPTLTVRYQNNNTPKTEQSIMAARFVAAMQREGLVAPSRGGAALAEGDAKLHSLTEEVARLRSLLQQQSQSNEQARSRQDEEHLRRAKQLEEDFESRWKRGTEELEERRNLQRQGETETQLQRQRQARALEKKTEQLREREESLGLQGEREARRRLRGEIQAAAKLQFESPDLSEQAKENFNRVATLCKWIIGVALVIFLLGLFGPPLIDIFTDKPLTSDWLLLAWTIRGFTGAALAIAITFYVRWLSNWSHQVTKNELQSKQFALDLDRASWLVEMALEYEKEGKTLPPNLVESFSRGLFGGASATSDEQPSSALATLLAHASEVKLGTNGFEATLSKAGIKRADAQASAAATPAAAG